MNKLKLINRVDKVNFVLSIVTFILWLGLFMSILLVNYDSETLRRFAMGSTFIVVIDIVLDILSCRRKSDGEIQ